ncbi:MAG: winged helix-turn-helix domain-containing protein [Thermoflexibacter sp.]
MENSLKLNANGKIWIETRMGRFIGSGKIELMEKIQRLGSIRQAAMEMQMSYRKAWGLIEQMNQMAGIPLVISQRGGKGGGQAVITEAGERFMALYKTYQENFQAFLQSQSAFFETFEQVISKKTE